MKLYNFNFTNDKNFDENNPFSSINCASERDAKIWCNYLLKMNPSQDNVIFWVADNPANKRFFKIFPSQSTTELNTVDSMAF